MPNPSSGAAGHFALAGTGATDDPSGLFQAFLDALARGIDLTVSLSDEAGASSSLTLSLASVAVESGAAPESVEAPRLAGPARIGEAVLLDQGTWRGIPAPDLAIAWLVDGALVPGAAQTRFVPLPEHDGRALAARVTATNEAGSATVETEPLVVAYAPPVATGTLPDLALVAGDAPATIETAGIFTGAALGFSATGPGVTIDPATGRLVVDPAAAGAATVTVTARNSGGAAETAFALVIAEKPKPEPEPEPEPKPEPLAAPEAVGLLADAVFERDDPAATVSAGAGFRGEALVFTLESAPQGFSIDAVSGLVRVPTAAPLAPAAVTVRARNEAGSASQTFRASVLDNRTIFGAAPALATVRFPQDLAPASWTIQGSGTAAFARLVSGTAERCHGEWSLARGDGRYRCLARWTHPETTSDWHRTLSFTGRFRREGTNLFGVQLDIVQRPAAPGAGPVRGIELRNYAGQGGSATELSFAPVAWEWNVWTWLELDLDGPRLRGRIWRDGTAVPAWQIAAETAQRGTDGLGGGGFGPGAFPRRSQATTVDIRRLEYRPLDAVQPSRPVDADWTIDQIKVQS